MSRLLLFVLVALVAAPLQALGQGQRPSAAGGPGVIQGAVLAETGQPLSSVSVVVRSAADSAVVAGELTGANGRFRVANLPPGRYIVQANLVGYAPFRRNVTVTPAEPAANLGNLTLRASAIELEGVVAQGERSAVVVAPDRTLYNTSDMPVASGGMATDVLQSVPELQVDIEGNVQMRGTGAQIYINGRPAPMEGESLQLFLQQFPADRIERIEVLPNPSARFEAEGAGGIVNIVLKKNVDLGISGNVFLNGGTRGDLGAGGRVTFQRGALTLFGGGFLRFMRRDNDSYDFRTNLLADPVTYLEQAGWNNRLGSMGNLDLTAEYKLNEKSTVWTEGRVFRRGNDSEALIGYTHMDAERVPTLRYDRSTDGESSDLRTDLVAGFRHVLQPQRHELEVEAQFQRGGDDDQSLIRRLFFTPTGGDAGLPTELTVEDEDEDELETELEVDYIRPWGENGQIEIGYQGALERTDNLRMLQIFEDEQRGTLLSTTESGFQHEEFFNSAYLTLMQKFGKLGVQAGLRAERADTRLTVPEGESYENDYGSIFPNANIRYDLGGGRELRLSYSKRIRRPSPWVLNPINRSDDPLNRRIGNPDIAPQYNHNFSIETSWSGAFGSVRFSPYYRRTVDDWAEIKTVDAAGVSTVTWQNLTSVENYGTSITANLRPIGGVGGFVNLTGYREVRDASNLSLDYSGADLQWSLNSNLQARVTDDMNLQLMANYRPERETPQGTIGDMLFSSVGVRQQLWNDKASLNLMVRDPLDIARFEFTSRDATHIQTGRSDFSMRSAVLSFSYSFGRPPRSQRRGGEGEGEQPMQEEGGEGEGGIR